MSLPKLPCEYKELGLKRTKTIFGDLKDSEKEHLIKIFKKCSDNLEKIKYERKK